MQIIRLDKDNLYLLDKFLLLAGDSLKTFRYFSKRGTGAVKNHVITLLGMEDDKPVAYGHLDGDGENTWLGMCVAWERRGSGLGKAMLAALLRFADTNGIGEIRLTVDEPNVSARKLYEKTGFVIEKTVNKVAYYRRKEPSQETVANEKM